MAPLQGPPPVPASQPLVRPRGVAGGFGVPYSPSESRRPCDWRVQTHARISLSPPVSPQANVACVMRILVLLAL